MIDAEVWSDSVTDIDADVTRVSQGGDMCILIEQHPDCVALYPLAAADLARKILARFGTEEEQERYSEEVKP